MQVSPRVGCLYFIPLDIILIFGDCRVAVRFSVYSALLFEDGALVIEIIERCFVSLLIIGKNGEIFLVCW